MAWLDVTPEKAKRARRESLPENSPHRAMPDIEQDEGLIQYFYEAGRFGFGMSGLIPLSWTELSGYLTTTGYYLSNWEKNALKSMSQAYVAEYYEARNPSAPSPVVITPTATQQDVSTQLKNVLRSIGKKSQAK